MSKKEDIYYIPVFQDVSTLPVCPVGSCYLDMRVKGNVYKLYPHDPTRYPLIEGISELVLSGGIPLNVLPVFASIGRKVLYKNVSYVMVGDIIKDTGLSKGSVSRYLTMLEGMGMIREMGRNTNGVGSRVYKVHPGYFWRGTYEVRGLEINKWIGGK